MSKYDVSSAINSGRRQSRYFQRDSYWYYATREGVNIGPFDTLAEAENGLGEFIEFIVKADDKTVRNFEAMAA